MQHTQRRRRLVGPVLVLERIDDHHGIHEGSQRGAGGWAQGSKCLLGGSVQFPLVHGSDAVPRAHLLPSHALAGGRRAVGAVAINAGQVLPLGAWIPPGISLEPPAPDGLDERHEVTMLAGLLVGGIEVRVAAA
jgi:hypothetical protein